MTTDEFKNYDGLLRMVPEKGLLIRQREKLGLSQEEVAEKAGIKIETYRKFENGERELSSSSFRIVHAVLSVLEYDITDFNKGAFVLEPLPKDDPLYSILDKI